MGGKLYQRQIKPYRRDLLPDRFPLSLDLLDDLLRDELPDLLELLFLTVLDLLLEVLELLLLTVLSEDFFSDLRLLLTLELRLVDGFGLDLGFCFVLLPVQILSPRVLGSKGLTTGLSLFLFPESGRMYRCPLSLLLRIPPLFPRILTASPVVV